MSGAIGKDFIASSVVLNTLAILLNGSFFAEGKKTNELSRMKMRKVGNVLMIYMKLTRLTNDRLV